MFLLAVSTGQSSSFDGHLESVLSVLPNEVHLVFCIIKHALFSIVWSLGFPRYRIEILETYFFKSLGFHTTWAYKRADKISLFTWSILEVIHYFPRLTPMLWILSMCCNLLCDLNNDGFPHLLDVFVFCTVSFWKKCHQSEDAPPDITLMFLKK